MSRLKRYLGYDWDPAHRWYQQIADGRHPESTYLVEVFERAGIDVQRGEFGELYALDETALDEIQQADDWFCQTIESIGFAAHEIARMKADGEWPEDES